MPRVAFVVGVLITLAGVVSESPGRHPVAAAQINFAPTRRLREA
jgi:hypothetical protein